MLPSKELVVPAKQTGLGYNTAELDELCLWLYGLYEEEITLFE